MQDNNTEIITPQKAVNITPKPISEENQTIDNNNLQNTTLSDQTNHNSELNVKQINNLKDDNPNINLFDIKRINERFNEELQQQINGTLPIGHVYQFGIPKAILLNAGIPKLPIELVASRLVDKSMQDNHPFELAEMKNLPYAIHQPLAVFNSATHIGSFVILTELKHNEKNYVVAIETYRHIGKLLVNSVRSIHYRNSLNIINWITNNLGKYFRDDFAQNWLEPLKNEFRSKPQYNPVDVRTKLILATKIIQDFKNPKPNDMKTENNQSEKPNPKNSLTDKYPKIEFEIPYIDYDTLKGKVSIIQILESLGYVYNKKEGQKYPNFYKYDPTGKVEEHIIVANPGKADEHYYNGHSNHVRKDIVSFVREHLNLFPANLTKYKHEWQNINAVLLSFTTNNYTETIKNIQNKYEQQEVNFNISNHNIFQPKLESLKYLSEQRQLAKDTLNTFLYYIKAEKVVLPNNKIVYNTVFPYNDIASNNNKITNLEIRNTYYKGHAEGGDKINSAWVATQNVQPLLLKKLFIFESAIDAMSYYEIHKSTLNINDCAFVSTGGNIAKEQISQLRQKYPNAILTCCFDNDLQGNLYDIKAWGIINNEQIKTHNKENTTQIEYNDKNITFNNDSLNFQSFKTAFNVKVNNNFIVEKPKNGKDFNEQLIYLKNQKTEKKQIKY